MKLYLCQYQGDGTDSLPFFLSIYNHATISTCDLRPDQSVKDGFALAWGDVTNAEHAAIIGDPSCIYIDPAALPMAVQSPVGDVANIDMITTLLMSRGIDASGLFSGSTILDVLHRVFPGAL